ncbi:MAG TPA: hypothetical protein VFH09_02265 [Nitrososphaera sp.]|nr:hypothetical protein [Nitrososphaera sp.]
MARILSSFFPQEQNRTFAATTTTDIMIKTIVGPHHYLTDDVHRLFFDANHALAGFTTFIAILGRYSYASNNRIDSCCSVLEQGAGSGFIPNLKISFKNFVIGITKLPQLHRQSNLKHVLKSSLYILVTAESACILTVETVDLIFYQYSILMSIPLALLAGAFAVVTPEAYRRMIKQKAV